MSTVREIFFDAIVNRDWGDICTVYEALTGEPAPDIPPQTSALSDVLNQPLEVTKPVNPMDQQLDVAANETADADDLLMPVEESTTIITSTQIPDILPATPPVVQRAMEPAQLPPDDAAAEFYIEHGSQQGGVNDDGETQCRKESMSIPQARKNRFHDNGRAFADEKVTTNPDDPKLGIQSIRPRGLVRDEELGANTGGTKDVICKLCGKNETVAARLAVGFNPDPEHNTYKCNECNTPNGRAKVMRRQRNAQLNSNAPRRGKNTNQRV